MGNRLELNRIIEKLDEYLGKNDYEAAARHLSYWMSEAEAEKDLRGAFTIANEQMGLYRKTGKEKEALKAADTALSLIESAGLTGTVSHGTCLVNSATMYKSFGRADKSIPLFDKAAEIYEKALPEDDGRLGGLYNNRALAFTDLEKYDEALASYEKAMSVMKKVKHGELEQAITLLNIADLYEKRDGRQNAAEIISENLDKALDLLCTEGIPHNGYYAFVCEKCAPTFGYYGMYDAENALLQVAKEIYEGA